MQPLRIGGVEVPPGTARSLELPFARLPSGSDMPLPIIAAQGVRPGPCLWLSAAVHGDEVNGVEIVRQVMDRIDPARIQGTLLAVPIVNVFGFVARSRYLPDRRDLNRSFPGSAKGSLAARLAHLVLKHVVTPATHGIDLHSGSHYRTNLPQIRADLRQPETAAMAAAFGAPVVLDVHSRDGSLRQAAAKMGRPCLVFEAGETGRLSRWAVDAGVAGVLAVITHLGMTPATERATPQPPRVVRKSTWVRATRAGILRLAVGLGESIAKGATLGIIRDAFGAREAVVRAPATGVVIGMTRSALVYRGDALVHLALSESDPALAPR